MYTGWNDGQPVSIGRHADAAGSKKNMKTGDAFFCTANAKLMGECLGMQTSNSKKNGSGSFDDVPSNQRLDYL